MVKILARNNIMIEHPIRRSDWQALRSVYNSAFFCSLGFFVVGFLIPIIAYSFMNASAIEVALIFSLLTLGSAVFAPIAGKIAKTGRRRHSIFIGATIRAVAYLGMAVSVFLGNKYILIANSLIWGLGAAFYSVGSDAEISERVLQENRSEAFGRRQAANGKGSVFGAFVGFSIIISAPDTGIFIVFGMFAVSNLIGGIIVMIKRPPIEDTHLRPLVSERQGIIGLGIAALIIAAALDTFISALLTPFVELFIIEKFTEDLVLIALIYLPGGVISGIFGGRMGKIADHKSKTVIVSIAVIVGAISTLSIVYIPTILNFPLNLFSIALLFSISSATGVMAYTAMSSVFGTAYQGRASEGFGLYEAAMGFSRFSAPLVGGILWDFLDPSAPFILVGLSGFILVPIYVFGMRKYNQVLRNQDSL
ncbi:MFS transporter [Candidatus Thorarchaeota archaeon]|nr:MAG: MFS transporter [Candidatus Thorarchaeota archaeon]